VRRRTTKTTTPTTCNLTSRRVATHDGKYVSIRTFVSRMTPLETVAKTFEKRLHQSLRGDQV
jgi:hypothetical protein